MNGAEIKSFEVVVVVMRRLKIEILLSINDNFLHLMMASVRNFS